jgi:hypothetical protein
VERDARYVEAAVRRWQRATGKDAVHAETGESFDAFTNRMNEINSSEVGKEGLTSRSSRVASS